jgi:hypothetical protein
MEKWFLIYSTQNLAQASIVKGMLEENKIPVSLLNKQDSSYLNFGEIELYVPTHLKELASNLVNQVLMN